MQTTTTQRPLTAQLVYYLEAQCNDPSKALVVRKDEGSKVCLRLLSSRRNEAPEETPLAPRRWFQRNLDVWPLRLSLRHIKEHIQTKAAVEDALGHAIVQDLPTAAATTKEKLLAMIEQMNFCTEIRHILFSLSPPQSYEKLLTCKTSSVTLVTSDGEVLSQNTDENLIKALEGADGLEETPLLLTAIAMAMDPEILVPPAHAIEQAVGTKDPITWDHRSHISIKVSPSSSGDVTIEHDATSDWKSLGHQGTIPWKATIVLDKFGALKRLTTGVAAFLRTTVPANSLLTIEEITDALMASWDCPMPEAIIYTHFRAHHSTQNVIGPLLKSINRLEEEKLAVVVEGGPGDVSQLQRALDRVSRAVGAPLQDATSSPYPILSNEFAEWLTQRSRAASRMAGLLQAASPTLPEIVVGRLVSGSDLEYVCLAEGIQFALGKYQDSVTQTYKLGLHRASAQWGETNNCTLFFEIQTTLDPYGRPKSIEVRPAAARPEPRFPWPVCPFERWLRPENQPLAPSSQATAFEPDSQSEGTPLFHRIQESNIVVMRNHIALSGETRIAGVLWRGLQAEGVYQPSELATDQSPPYGALRTCSALASTKCIKPISWLLEKSSPGAWAHATANLKVAFGEAAPPKVQRLVQSSFTMPTFGLHGQLKLIPEFTVNWLLTTELDKTFIPKQMWLEANQPCFSPGSPCSCPPLGSKRAWSCPQARLIAQAFVQLDKEPVETLLNADPLPWNVLEGSFCISDSAEPDGGSTGHPSEQIAKQKLGKLCAAFGLGEADRNAIETDCMGWLKRTKHACKDSVRSIAVAASTLLTEGAKAELEALAKGFPYAKTRWQHLRQGVDVKIAGQLRIVTQRIRSNQTALESEAPAYIDWHLQLILDSSKPEGSLYSVELALDALSWPNFREEMAQQLALDFSSFWLTPAADANLNKGVLLPVWPQNNEVTRHGGYVQYGSLNDLLNGEAEQEGLEKWGLHLMARQDHLRPIIETIQARNAGCDRQVCSNFSHVTSSIFCQKGQISVLHNVALIALERKKASAGTAVRTNSLCIVALSLARPSSTKPMYHCREISFSIPHPYSAAVPTEALNPAAEKVIYALNGEIAKTRCAWQSAHT